jgi:hypothetical protein
MYEYYALILYTKGTFSFFVFDLLYIYKKSLVGFVMCAKKVTKYIYLTIDFNRNKRNSLFICFAV